MGAVYEAVDARLENTVAVKQITMHGLVAASAFEQEARLLAGLRHPALPVVIDHFTDARGQFLVMQYIEGEDLSRLLSHQQHPCAADDVVAWARVILEALIYLHEQAPPVVHRDIKPANLRRTTRGEIVLLDFGLAKGGREDDTHLAGDRSVFGYTRRYAPPEQVAGAGTDARSDLYSLAATLFHLATGEAPPEATERLRAIERDGRDPFDPARYQPLTQHPSLSGVIGRAMAIAPADRFASARQMLEAITETSTPAASASVLPRRDPTTRRVDAAMPSQVEVGRQVDLLLQVRFADSPLLGLEDWPPRRRPDVIEQRSEEFRVRYPEDPTTRRLLPARLRIKLAAPDFVVAGDAARTVDVPPDDFSPRVAFLLTARRPGLCRINVEVYTSENVYVGSVPIESEGVAAAIPDSPDMRVANLVLEVLTRQVQEAERKRALAQREAAALPIAGEAVAIGADLPGAQGKAAEAPRLRAQAAALDAVRSPVGAHWARRIATLAPVVVVAFVGGWLMWDSQRASSPAVPPLAGAPTASANPPAIDGSTQKPVGLPPSAPVPAPSSPQVALIERGSPEARAVMNAVREYRRDLLSQYARLDPPMPPPLRLAHCLQESEASVIFESSTRATVACDRPARATKEPAALQIILERRNGVWRVIAPR